MKILHVINKQSSDGPGLRNLRPPEQGEDLWTSGYWDIPLEDAETLVGGNLYLHETKSRPSRFGGRVIAVEEVECDGFARAKRVIFKILALPEARGVKWRGADHAMASYGKIMDVED